MEKVDQNSLRFAGFFNDENIQVLAKDLSTALTNGSICIDSQAFKSLLEDKNPFISYSLNEPKPFIAENQTIYIYRYFQYQERILHKIQELVSRNTELIPTKIKQLLANQGLPFLIEKIDSERKVDWQTVAAILAYLTDFMIITGGPGTGKTTTVAKILTLILSENSNAEIKMAAPTGKAANRMEQALKANQNIPEELIEKIQTLRASTIHRLLGTNYLSPYFKHHSENPISADVIIIDESSMLDVALFSKLLEAIGPKTKLILLGDQNQLASVEAGSLFGDICNSVDLQNKLPKPLTQEISLIFPKYDFSTIHSIQDSSFLQSNLIALNHSYRFKYDQKIAQLSRETVKGNWEDIQLILKDDSTPDQLVFDESYNEKLVYEFAEQYADYIQENDITVAIRKLEDLRILCAVKLGKQGIYETNKQVEKILTRKGLIKPHSEFYENRPLIVGKNYHDLGLFNGDIGIIRDKSAWFLDEKGNPISIAPGLISEVETVFAMTIHKSQGSEFKQVLMILPDKSNVEILTRELIYTGITRAKSKILIQGKLELIQEAVSRKVNRASRLKEKLQAIS